MSANTISFIAWAFLMLAVLVAIIIAAKKSKSVEDEAEEIASKALPVIGKIANKKHIDRFGRAPTSSVDGESWYPENKKKFAKHA